MIALIVMAETFFEFVNPYNNANVSLLDSVLKFPLGTYRSV